MVRDEAKTQTGLTPVDVTWVNNPGSGDPTLYTYQVSFSEPTKARWTLFGTSLLAR